MIQIIDGFYNNNRMLKQSQTLIFTSLVFTNCGIPICDDILAKLLARQCEKHGKIEYCNVIGSKNIGFVKFQSIDDAIFVKKLMNNQILFKSIVKIGFVNTKQKDRIGKMLEDLL